MGRQIFKHAVSFYGCEISLHQYAKIVKVESIEGKIFFWEEHLTGLKQKYNDEPAEPVMESWRFTVWPTGTDIPDHVGAFVGTVLDNQFVWHVYATRVKK